jgi:hypothetical protein
MTETPRNEPPLRKTHPFHTRISFEAKQLTLPAYERLRTRQPDKFEQMVLEAFQKKVSADVPVPPGASDIPTTREE